METWRPSDPVLLFVHGVAGSSTTWKAVMPALASRYTVIAPDLPGHGESDKPRVDYSLGAHANVLRDLMIALDVERATIVGQSLGGGVAMQLAYQHPQRCERLVLVSSGGLGPEVSWMLRAMTLPGAEYLMPVLFPSVARVAGSAVGRRLARLGFRAPRLEQEWRAYVSLTEPDNRQAFIRTLRAVVDPRGQAVSAHDRLYLASHLPTLIVWGARDRIIPVESRVDSARGDPRQPTGDLREVRPLPAHRRAGALHRGPRGLHRRHRRPRARRARVARHPHRRPAGLTNAFRVCVSPLSRQLPYWQARRTPTIRDVSVT